MVARMLSYSTPSADGPEWVRMVPFPADFPAGAATWSSTGLSAQPGQRATVREVITKLSYQALATCQSAYVWLDAASMDAPERASGGAGGGQHTEAAAGSAGSGGSAGQRRLWQARRELCVQLLIEDYQFRGGRSYPLEVLCSMIAPLLRLSPPEQQVQCVAPLTSALAVADAAAMQLLQAGAAAAGSAAQAATRVHSLSAMVAGQVSCLVDGECPED
jgi:hypothetical protein